MQDAVRWRLSQQFHFHNHSKEWPDGAVVYDPASGDTHHLALPAFQLLKMLSQTSYSAMDMARQFIPELEGITPDEVISDITLLLNDLHALGLIEPERQ